jgi:serine/threonine-protein kinase
MTLAPGTTVGRYQILEPLGQGGMATVYKAFQPSLEREVALKVLRPGFAQDQEFRERFEREAKSIARLRHPNVVQVFDFEIAASGEFVLAMEYLEGGTLKDRMVALAAQGRGLDPNEAMRILWEVADALSYAHEQGIVHRDVKPSNVMLAKPRDRAVVTDFGIARILGATSHTQTGVGIGTPEYMAPEQGQGGKVDHRADIYSLGAMAYELFTGRVPYTADTPLAIVIAHIKDPLPLPSKVNPTIGTGVERALLRALAKDPAQRFDSALAFAEALKAGLAEDTTGGTMPTIVVRADAPAAPSVRAAVAPKRVAVSLPPVLARRPVVLGVAGGLVMAIVAGAVLVSGALRPAVTAEAAKVPARGALIWQAKLDGTNADARSVPQPPAGADPTANEFRFVRGAIEYASLKSTATGSGQGFQFNSPGRDVFVLEADVEAQAGLQIRFNWWEASSQRYGFSIDVGSGRVQLEYSRPGGIVEPLATAVTVDDVRRANPFTAAIVVERSRFTGYINGRQVVQAAPDGRVPPLSGSVGVTIGGKDVGTVRLTGIRLYELPATTTTGVIRVKAARVYALP